MKLDYHNPYPERFIPRYLIDREARRRRKKIVEMAIAGSWVVLLTLLVYVVGECALTYIESHP